MKAIDGGSVDPVIEAFGMALIGAMATDTWQEARDAVARLWRRIRGREPGGLEGELQALRRDAVAARRAGQADQERFLAAAWQDRLRALLAEDPAAATDFRAILDEVLLPKLAPAEREQIGQVLMHASADRGTVTQVAGDLHITYMAPGLGKTQAAAVVEAVVPMAMAQPFLLVGRDPEVDRLLEMLDPGVVGASAVLVSAIEGLAGVGKTALARRAASIAADRGWFPGGALFADLHGYDPVSRVSAGQLFGPLLLALGLGSAQVPRTESGQAAVYHQVLDERSKRGRPVLVVLDNVASAAQVKGLVSGHAAHRMLITSRNALISLEAARPLRLLSLGPADSVTVLEEVLRGQDPGDQRLSQESEYVAQLARLCAGLPLALRIAAALLARDPALLVEDLVRELDAAGNRLPALADGERAVRQAFDSSWQNLRALDPQAADLIRLLAVNPGPDMSEEAAAELAGEPLTDVRRWLRALGMAYLIERGAAGRWRMHDLVRDYARQRAEDEIPAPARRAALGRLARFCYGSVNYAFDQQIPGNLMVDSGFLITWKQEAPDAVRAVDKAGRPAAWFERERSGLLALVRAAEEARPPLEITPRLACSLFYFLERGGHFVEWAQAEDGAARVAFASGDRHDQARSLRNRGRLALVEVLEDNERVRGGTGPSAGVEQVRLEAIERLELSRRYYREEYAEHQRFRDRTGEATTMRELADAYRLGINPAAPDAGKVAAATQAYDEAERIYASLDSNNGLASLWLARGITHTLAGQFAEARAYLDRSLEYAAQPGPSGRPMHARLMGYALRLLGDLYLRQDQAGNAAGAYRRSAEVFTADGDSIGAARVLASCGEAEASRANLAAARQALEAAREYFASRALGDNDPEAAALAVRLREMPAIISSGT
jgi:tetratricopeptide (TPR) repeat protein